MTNLSTIFYLSLWKTRSFFQPFLHSFLQNVRQSVIMALIISNWRTQNPKIPIGRFHSLVETFCTPCTFNPVCRSRCTWCDWMLAWLAPRTTSWTRAEFLIILQWYAANSVYYFRICDTLFVRHYDSSRRRYRYHRHMSHASLRANKNEKSHEPPVNRRRARDR